MENLIFIEQILTNFDNKNEILKNIVLINDQIPFLIENLVFIFEIRPFKRQEIIDFLINLYDKIMNQKLFKLLLLIIGSERCPLIIYELFKKNFFLEIDINNNIIYIENFLFKIYFSKIFNLNFLEIQNYLKVQNPLPKTFEELKELLDFGWFKDSIEYFIKFDNFSNFLEKIKINEINFLKEFETNNFEIFLNKKKYSYYSLSALYGSINIFKYIFLLNSNINSNIHNYCLQSGNLELFHFFDSNLFLNLDSLKISLYYRYYDISNWILDNFSFKYISGIIFMVLF